MGCWAMYYVTICTHNRERFFCNVTDGKMHLSEAGEIANRFWKEIPEHFPFVRLGKYVIIPDHVHGIIIIDKTDDNNGGKILNTRDYKCGGTIVDTSNLDVSATGNIRCYH